MIIEELLFLLIYVALLPVFFSERSDFNNLVDEMRKPSITQEVEKEWE